MKSVYTGILFTLLTSILLAQDSIKIKSSTSYSMQDTTGISFRDSNEIAKYIWNTKEYDRNGNLTKETQFPFPHNPTFYKTTEVSYYQYSQDSTIIHTYTGLNELVSKKFTYSKNRQRYTKTINYGILNSSDYKKLDTIDITEVTYDSVNNLVFVIQLKEKNNHIDTIRKYHRQMIPPVDSTFFVQRSSRRIAATDTLRTSNLCFYGLFTIFSEDTVFAFYKQIIKIDSVSNQIEAIRIDLSQDSQIISKTCYETRNDLIVNLEKQKLIKNKWQIFYKEYNEYDNHNNRTLHLRDDYRNGQFSYRFVTYTEYEYYN